MKGFDMPLKDTLRKPQSAPRRITALIIALFLFALTGCGSPPVTEATAPPFALPSATGDNVSLSDYTGQQPVLLYFHMAVG